MELNAGLACRRLNFRWPGRRTDEPLVLESVEAIFCPGTVSLVSGNTGSGKSTLLHLLAGLLDALDTGSRRSDRVRWQQTRELLNINGIVEWRRSINGAGALECSRECQCVAL